MSPTIFSQKQNKRNKKTQQNPLQFSKGGIGRFLAEEFCKIQKIGKP